MNIWKRIFGASPIKEDTTTSDKKEEIKIEYYMLCLSGDDDKINSTVERISELSFCCDIYNLLGNLYVVYNLYSTPFCKEELSALLTANRIKYILFKIRPDFICEWKTSHESSLMIKLMLLSVGYLAEDIREGKWTK